MQKALTAGAKILACVGETEDGDSEELTEWLELLQTNNELREDLHEGVATQRRKELNEAARRGTVYIYAVGISAVYTTSTAAMHVALEMIRWRAKTLESKDKDIIPDNVGYVTAEGVLDPQNNTLSPQNNERTSKFRS
jgi:hypothetical protein